MPGRPLRPLRIVVAMVLSLLFSQLALANYVCPAQVDRTTAEAAAAMLERMAAGTPCDEADAAQPVLCHQHATGALQSFETVKLPVASPPMILQVSVLPALLQAAAAIAVPATAAADAHPPPDPVFLATLRLRV